MSVSRSAVRRDRQPLGYVPDDAQPSMPTLRRSLTANQRTGTSKQYTVRPPVPADVFEEEDMRDTDDLVFSMKGDEDPITNPTNTTGSRRLRRTATVPQQRKFPWLRVGFGLIVLVLSIWLVMHLVLAAIDFCTDVSNTFHYGPNRTMVISGIFGHNDSPTNQTEIVAINLHGTLLIQEVPGGDVTKTKTYSTGLMLVGDVAAKTPIQLAVKELNGDHKPDVLITIPGQDVTLKLINNGTTFTLAH